MISALDLVYDDGYPCPSVELHQYFIEVAESYFEGTDSVEVDVFMEDFSPSAIEDLWNRSQRATQVLFDVPRIETVINDDRRKSHSRLSEEEYTFGWYVCSYSGRDDGGVERKLNALRAMSGVQRMMSSQRVDITVDKNGSKNSFHPRQLEIIKLQNIPNLAVFQLMYTIKVTRDLLV